MRDMAAQVTDRSVEEHRRFIAWSDLVEGHFRFLAWSVFTDDRISDEEKLETYRHIRSLGVLPEEATFFLIQFPISCGHEDRVHEDAEIIRIEKEMGAIEERYNVDGDRVPKKYRALENRWEARARVLMTEALRREGEEEMARLLEKDEARFDGLVNAGRDYFHRVYDSEQIPEAIDRRVEAGRRASRKAMAGQEA